MLEKIEELEKIARQLQPHAENRLHWQRAVEKYAFKFIDGLETRKTFVVSETNGSGILEHPISDEPIKIEEALALLEEHVDTPGLDPASGGHLAYIPGGGLFPTALGDYLADVSNRYAGIFFGGPGAVRLENMLIKWMCEVMGYPNDAHGNLTSGGSIANLIAIVTARDFKKITSKKVDKAVIYITSHVHHCVQKAIKIAGLGEAKVSYIPVDEQFKMDVNVLLEEVENDVQAGLQPFLLIGSAGTTNVGTMDPLDKLADVAEKYDMWFHVDGAYGGFFILSEETKEIFKGIERSDSLVIDPHKGLFLSYGLGAVLVKNVEALRASHQYQADYMQDAVEAMDELSPADLSPELTKPFRGLRLWLPLKLFGLQPFKAALSEKIWLTRYFYEEIQKIGFEVGPYPELSVMIYRYIPEEGDADAFNTRLIKLVQEDGRVFLSSTTIDGVYWLRLAVLSFRTHKHTIDLCLQVLKESVAKIEAESVKIIGE